MSGPGPIGPEHRGLAHESGCRKTGSVGDPAIEPVVGDQTIGGLGEGCKEAGENGEESDQYQRS